MLLGSPNSPTPPVLGGLVVVIPIKFSIFPKEAKKGLLPLREIGYILHLWFMQIASYVNILIEA
jgi:hypothetical protein